MKPMILDAYLDDRLAPEARRDVELALESDANLRDELATLEQLRGDLQQMSVPEPRDASEHWADVKSSLEKRGRLVAWPVKTGAWATAAAAALVALLVWSPFGHSPPSPSSITYVETHIEGTVPVVYTDAESGWAVVWLSNTNLESADETL